MAKNNSKNIATLLTGAYKGIEGCYILNDTGALGYFTADGQQLVKERFDGPEDAPATESIDAFLAALNQASGSFPPGDTRELGYLKPSTEETVWQTATLILHDQVARELREGVNRELAKGRMTLAEGDRQIGEMTQERGLHRGFGALLGHIGSFGTPIYFPVLYYRKSSEGSDSEFPMRVLNLLSLLPDHRKVADVLATMRRRLTERGVLNEASRVEHRFKLVGEDD